MTGATLLQLRNPFQIVSTCSSRSINSEVSVLTGQAVVQTLAACQENLFCQWGTAPSLESQRACVCTTFLGRFSLV